MNVCFDNETHHDVEETDIIDKEKYNEKEFPTKELFCLNETVDFYCPRLSGYKLIDETNWTKNVPKVLNIEPDTSLSDALRLSCRDDLVKSCDEVTAEYVGLMVKYFEGDNCDEKKKECIDHQKLEEFHDYFSNSILDYGHFFVSVSKESKNFDDGDSSEIEINQLVWERNKSQNSNNGDTQTDEVTFVSL